MGTSQKRHAHELILEELEETLNLSEDNIFFSGAKYGMIGRFLGFLEKMLISPDHAKRTADELERLLKKSLLCKDHEKQVEDLIREFRA